MRNDEPISIGESLGEVLRGLRPVQRRGEGRGEGRAEASVSALGGVFGRWEEAVGEQVAAHVQPVKLDGATLVVSVDDPAWATQLRFLETMLRDRLFEVAGARIEQIEVRVARPGERGRARRVENTSQRP